MGDEGPATTSGQPPQVNRLMPPPHASFLRNDGDPLKSVSVFIKNVCVTRALTEIAGSMQAQLSKRCVSSPSAHKLNRAQRRIGTGATIS